MMRLTISMVLDFGGCWLTEITCKALFADLEPKEFVTRGRTRREMRRAMEELVTGEKKTQ
jgi:cation-transporting ATPase 13A1